MSSQPDSNLLKTPLTSLGLSRHTCWPGVLIWKTRLVSSSNNTIELFGVFDDEDMYLILACDGIWDVMSNEDVGTFVTRRVNEEMHKLNSRSDGEVLASVGDDLLAACLEAGSRDNMSVLIVAFPASGLAHVHFLCVTPSLATIGNNSNPLPVVDDATVRVIDFD